MKIKALIADLQRIADSQGDIEVQLQDDPTAQPAIVDDHAVVSSFEKFFICEEPYPDGFRVSLRTWPY